MLARTTPTQTVRGAKTRARLLAAAGRVFAAEGYHAATLDAIAGRAGVSKGALYYSFDSKEALFLALLEARLAARASEALGDGTVARPPEITPEEWASRAMGSMTLDRDWNLLFMEFACFAARNPKQSRQLVEALRSFRAGAAQWLEGVLAEAGIDSPVPAERMARVIAALGNGLALDVIIDPGPSGEAEARDTMAAAMATLWRGTASAAADSVAG